MSNTVKGISTAKGFHGKVPFAEHADKITLLDAEELPLYENEVYHEEVAKVSETGVYLAIVSVIKNGALVGYGTGVIAIPDLEVSSSGAVFAPMDGDNLLNVTGMCVVYTNEFCGLTVRGTVSSSCDYIITAYKIIDL